MSPPNSSLSASENTEIIDFKHEISNEFNNHSYDSLRIWKMFQSKKSNLPNNQRIQNLSWRVNSISNAKKRPRVLRHSQTSDIQQKNLSLLKSANHPTNEEFDYIEHIKQMTKEEFGDYNNSSISQIPLPTDYNSSNPIAIINPNGNNGNIDYSPEAANSLTSNSNSVFSNNKYDHSLSVSSQVSHQQKRPSRSQQAAPRRNSQQQIMAQQQAAQAHLHKQHSQAHPSTQSNEFDIDHFLDLDTKASDLLTDKNDSNFNEFDLLDFTKFDQLHQNDTEFIVTPGTVTGAPSSSSIHPEHKIDNFSLSNYISSLETAVKEDHKSANFTTPIFNNQTTINETFTIPNNTNYNVTINPKAQKEQLSCNSCGTTTTPLWRKSTNEKNENLILCNACGLFLKLHGNLSKRNVGGKKIFTPMSNGVQGDDQMGEIFAADKHARSGSTAGTSFASFQEQQQQAAAMQRATSAKVKEEDYDWLKFGL